LYNGQKKKEGLAGPVPLGEPVVLKLFLGNKLIGSLQWKYKQQQNPRTRIMYVASCVTKLFKQRLVVVQNLY